MRSLKMRLIVAIGILLTVSVVVLTFISYMRVRQQIVDDLTGEIRGIARGYRSDVSNWITGNLSMIDSMAAAVGKGADLDVVLPLVRNGGNFVSVYQGKPDKTFKNFPPDPLPPGYDPTVRPWYKGAMEAKKPFVSSPYMGVAPPGLMITFAAPVNGGENGVVGADILLTQIVERVLKIKLTGDGYAFLLDKSGQVLAHPDQARAMKPAKEITPTLSAENLGTLAQQEEMSVVDLGGSDHFLLLRPVEHTDIYLALLIDKNKALAPLNRLLLYSLLSLIALLIIVMPIAAWLIGHMLTDLLHVRDAMVAIASGGGDLSQKIEIHGEDEVAQTAQAFNQFSGQLLSMVLDVRRASDSISTGTTEIAAGNMDLSGRTEQQASSLEETVASMDELTNAVQNNASNARDANQMATNASHVAMQGGEVVDQVVATMQDISSSSNKIVDIISVIEGIAFQTNILALNAAVEAARAGEQGRGFAVVASEVRTLAQRSAAAAQEIKSLIEDSVHKVSAGSALVDRAGKAMVEIVKAVQQVNQIIGEITAASAEQSDGIQQVNQALAHMDQATQQNAALVEQAAAAAGSLEEQAASLRQAMSAFRTGDGESGRVRSMAAGQVAKARPTSPQKKKAVNSAVIGYDV